jgi:hypothetical protein
VTDIFSSIITPEFPAQTIESGQGVVDDVFFHSSLINSIMNFGYPSTGLDGAPFAPYHVLSHYVDAGILTLTGLSPLDSAGFFLQLKIMLFVTAILTMLWLEFRAMPSWVQLVAPIALLPAFSMSWYVVGSHALWFTLILVIISAPFVFTLIASMKEPTNRSLLALGLLGTALSLGKISVGFMFMLVVGLMLWLRNMRDVRVYLLGFGWAVWTVGYGFLIAQDRTDQTEVTYSLLEHVYAVARFVLMRDMSQGLVLGLYALITLLLVAAILRPTEFHRRILGVSLVGTGVLVVLAAAKMDRNDQFYLTQALFFILLTLSISLVAQFARDTEKVALWRTGRAASVQSVVVVTALVLLGIVGAKSDFSVVNPNSSIIRQSLAKAFAQATPSPPTKSGPFAFRAALAEFMAQNGLSYRNATLFIPREMWPDIAANTRMASHNEDLWSLPLMVYAETGIALYKGVYATHQSYGFSAYGPDSITPTRAEFEESNRCGATAIIEVLSWSPAKFTLACKATQ